MDSPAPCTNNCGFFGSPANNGLCSKCYNDYLKKKMSESEKSPVTQCKNDEQEAGLVAEQEASLVAEQETGLVAEFRALKVSENKKNRCDVCNKKIGLLGFKCKCGGAFCGMHRYPEVHSCGVDYKTPGRLMLAKQNPLCSADKLSDRFD